jgi:integrase
MAARSITTVKARGELKPRHAAYRHRIRKRCYLGFRKTSATSPGAWLALYTDETNKTTAKSLGDFSNLPPSDQFDAARLAAEEWFRHMDKGGSSKPQTVRGACEAYVERLRENKGEDAAKDAEGRFKRWVYSSRKLADMELMRLSPKVVEAWVTSLRKAPVILQDKSQKGTEPRSDASINRDMTALRAALNLALENGEATDDTAWRGKLKPIKNADGRREVYLTPSQRRELIEKAAPDLASFLKAMSLLPLRPGAVADLRVKSFDKRFSALVIGKDKTGRDRTVVLPPATAALFVAQTKNKLPAAPIFTRADGKAWNKDAWKGPVKDAVVAAKLPDDITAYALRHSVITDLVAVHRLPTLTVAQMSGTSVAMIERHYGRLLQDQAREGLALLAL